MPERAADFAMVRNIGLTFPGVEESTAYGSPALKLHGRIVAAIAVNRSAEPNSLGLSIDSADRDELIAAQPDIYYVTDLYAAGNWVLVRLSQVDPNALRDLFGMAYKFASRNAHKKRK